MIIWGLSNELNLIQLSVINCLKSRIGGTPNKYLYLVVRDHQKVGNPGLVVKEEDS
jgi:hypothetical protein